jgi:hypothetical protein
MPDRVKPRPLRLPTQTTSKPGTTGQKCPYASSRGYRENKERGPCGPRSWRLSIQLSYALANTPPLTRSFRISRP